MYYLATCDNKGKCFGYLRTDNTISKNPDDEMSKIEIKKIHVKNI